MNPKSFVVALALAGGLPTVASAAAQSFPEPANTMIKVWMDLNGRCRGGSGKIAEVACQGREQLTPRIVKYGYCYGKRGQIGADMAWHRCEATSLR